MSQHPEFHRAQQIRKTMAVIRRELDDDLDHVEQSARTLMDWRYYIKNYPWACVGVAAAIGYFVIPRRLEINSPDPKTLEKLARDRHLVVEQKPEAEAKGGLLGGAFSFISGLILKTAMAQVGAQLASLMQGPDQPANGKGAQRPRSAPGPSPASSSARRPH